jgi:cytochrome c oxidase cbb3-type subunit 3
VPRLTGRRAHAEKWPSILLLAILTFLKTEPSRSIGAATQERELKNPFSGQYAAIEEGQSIFRNQCAMCHGTDAQGGLKGPSLTSGRLTHGVSDSALFRIITQGVPGTPMSASNLAPERTWKVITYLRSRAGRAGASSLGNPRVGEQLFFKKVQCSQCHMVNGRGGRLGPDLSRIGAARSVSYLTDKIREPDKLGKDMTVGLWWELGQPLVYQTVTLVTKEGRRITGSLRNEDTFSIQLMDPDEELRLFLKNDLQEVIHEPSSLMPRYGEQMLSQPELQDLLAYLDGLRGP